MIVEFMSMNGTWKRSGMHENNVKKNYKLFKSSRLFGYYIKNDMIYRLSCDVNVLEGDE